MNNTLSIVTVNEKQAYHDCEMIFSFYYRNEKSDFKVDEDQKYKIHTTLQEIQVLNEALNLYQEEGFKEAYLLYIGDKDGNATYPEFAPRFQKACDLTKQLQALSNDEDSLVQLSEYCLETPPTYVDDFGINKQIESITINGMTKDIAGYEDLKSYLLNR